MVATSRRLDNIIKTLTLNNLMNVFFKIAAFIYVGHANVRTFLLI